MLSDEIRARIATLAASASHSTRSSVNVPAHANARPVQQVLPLALPRGVTSAEIAFDANAFDLSTGEVHGTSSGEHLRFRRPLVELWPAADMATNHTRQALAAQGDSVDLHPELAAVAVHFPQATMFLDLETCGFAGAPVFLAGVVWRDAGVLVVDQLFARTYAEERALLETLTSIAAEQQVLATFNGKSFDWPMVCDRSIRHRLNYKLATPLRKPRPVAADTLVHCDLLHHARRRWKHVLPNCKLQTLERLVCRRVRHDDLPGADVPAAYHQFVRTGASGQIGSILLHNALDLVTLVEVTLRLMHLVDAARPRLSEAS